MRTAVWVVAGVIGALSALLILMNYGVWLRDLRKKPGEPNISVVPVVGGLLGFVALRLTKFAAFPEPGCSGYAWLPPLLDPGCYVVLLLLLPVQVAFRRLFRPTPPR